MEQAKKDIPAGRNLANPGMDAPVSKPDAHKPHNLRPKIEMILLVLIVTIGGGVLGVTAGGMNRPKEQAVEKSTYSADWIRDYVEQDIVAQPEFGQYQMPPVAVSVQGSACRFTIALMVRKERLAGARPIFTRNTPKLRNWLIGYFFGLTVEQTRGASNFTYLRNDIRDNFNRILWPDEKGLIERVDFIQNPRFD
ncbi:MAG: flagellar basal body-associated FliL family protein [Planctomycetes bacterium]|nr:flagellar basal body-associated FliL family protein [Planctomycetota bacterium]